MNKENHVSFVFGPFRLNAPERRLMRDGVPVPLAPKVFDTLVALVEHRGRLVDKDELIGILWPDTFVEESTLARNVSDLRKVLGETSGEGKYIETVPKAGYRFVAIVAEQSGEESTLILHRRTRSRVIVEDEIGGGLSISSIAVLPLKLLGAVEADEDYLGLGMADALITRFTKIRRIRVRPTSAIASYSGRSYDPVATGKLLGVDSVLEGNIQRVGDRIRVTVQLVSVDDGASLWAEKFDERFTDIFAVEDSISEQVARAVVLELTADERMLLRKRYTDNTDAYQLYLKGRYYWNKRTPGWLNKGLECFRQAIEVDPTYATAYAGLSDSYTLLGVYYGSLPASEAFSQAKAAAAMALGIDETLGEAHASRAHAMLHNWEWEGAEQGFRSAIEFNPDYPSTHHWYSEYLLATGQLEAALAAVERARDLDPLSLIINTHISDILFFARQYEESAAQCEKVLEMDPGFALARVNLARGYVRLGRYEQAIEEFQRIDFAGERLDGLWMVGEMYATWGKREAAIAILDGLVANREGRYVSPCGIAMIFAALGDDTAAFKWLETAYEMHDCEVFNLKVEPRFDIIRGDRRYQDLLRRVGLQS